MRIVRSAAVWPAFWNGMLPRVLVVALISAVFLPHAHAQTSGMTTACNTVHDS